MERISANEIIQAPGEEFDLLKESIKQEINCAKPGIVQSYNPNDQTATIEPAIQSQVGGKNLKPPILTDVPVFFPGGASSGIVFPIQKGDECLVVFADCCIDAWFQNGGSSTPISVRKHDLSDGFAFVGFRSKKNSLSESASRDIMSKAEIIDVIYPIGSVYHSVNPTDPSQLFGGTWEPMPEMLMYVWKRVG